MLNKIHVYENENYFAWKSLIFNNIGDLIVFNIEIIFGNGFRLILQDPNFSLFSCSSCYCLGHE